MPALASNCKLQRQIFWSTINAPRFDCEFFPAAKTCTGGQKTKTIRVPTISQPGHGEQTLTAERLTAQFSQQSKDIEQLNASGNVRFNELDNNAVAAEMIYTRADETIRLRGGDPTGWNSSYRSKAREIDWDTRKQHSYLRGKVSTTYLQSQDGGMPPLFGQSVRSLFS